MEKFNWCPVTPTYSQDSVTRRYGASCLANYIDKTILCQAYLHVEEIRLSVKARADFEKFLQEYFPSRGQFFLTERADVEVESKIGSDILYLTLHGVGPAIVAAVAGYPLFRTGVKELSRDAKRLTDGVIIEALFQMRSTQFEAIRVESRTGVFGRLDNIINLMDKFESRLEVTAWKTAARRIVILVKAVDILLYHITDAGDLNYVKTNLRQIAAETVPARIPSARGDRLDRIKYQQAHERLFFLLS